MEFCDSSHHTQNTSRLSGQSTEESAPKQITRRVSLYSRKLWTAQVNTIYHSANQHTTSEGSTQTKNPLIEPNKRSLQLPELFIWLSLSDCGKICECWRLQHNRVNDVVHVTGANLVKIIPRNFPMKLTQVINGSIFSTW